MRPFLTVAGLLAISAAPSYGAPSGDWRVDLIDGKAPIAGSKVTMRFEPKGRVSGIASCNRYGAAYTVEGDNISFGPAMTTRMACPPDIMAQEQRFLRVLEGAATWRIGAERLIIRTADGPAIEASATKF